MKLSKKEDRLLKKRVYRAKTKNVQGFTSKELEKLYKRVLKKYPDMSKKKYEEAFYGNTCILIGDEVVNYHVDVLTALRCAVENREIQTHEWD